MRNKKPGIRLKVRVEDAGLKSPALRLDFGRRSAQGLHGRRHKKAKADPSLTHDRAQERATLYRWLGMTVCFLSGSKTASCQTYSKTWRARC
jgi:hypothetical protein